MIPDLPYMIKAITEYIIAQVAFLDYSIRKDWEYYFCIPFRLAKYEH